MARRKCNDLIAPIIGEWVGGRMRPPAFCFARADKAASISSGVLAFKLMSSRPITAAAAWTSGRCVRLSGLFEFTRTAH